MKVLITGANGFIEHLKRDENIELYLYSKKDSLNILEAYVKEVDFIFHLAGVKEFYEGNSRYFDKNTPVLLSSSIQSELDNDYGKSKLEAEQSLVDYSDKTGANIWSKPNYNSVISTWCYNI